MVHGSEVIRDLAALNKVETLPWDVWGAMPTSGATLDGSQNAYFDRLAALTSDPDANFGELRRLYEKDPGLRVPSMVFNALLQRLEAL